MELTRPGTDVRLPRPHHYPAMTGEERLKALRAMRGMWKGQGQAIMQRIEAGAGKTAHCPRTRLSPVYVLDTNAIISYTDDEPSSSIVSIQDK